MDDPDAPRPAGELRRPIWLFPPVKPSLEAYRRFDDGRAPEWRRALAGCAGGADQLLAQSWLTPTVQSDGATPVARSE